MCGCGTDVQPRLGIFSALFWTQKRRLLILANVQNAVTNAVSSLSTLSVCLAVNNKKMVTRFSLKSF